MWHFGVDGLTEYACERFECMWEVAANVIIRAYTKDFRNGKHIRLEKQEYPRRSLVCAIEEKLNSTSTRTWSAPYHRLPNRPQYEREDCGIPESSASFNSKDENSRKSDSAAKGRSDLSIMSHDMTHEQLAQYRSEAYRVICGKG